MGPQSITAAHLCAFDKDCEDFEGPILAQLQPISAIALLGSNSYEEKYDRIDKELYGDVNVEQTQEQITGVQEESGPEMASIQGQYVEQATTTMTPTIHNANTEVPPLSSSHSVSSTYINAFLNLENLYSTETEVVSMMDINVQHKVLHFDLLPWLRAFG
ncbi:hypothetical protein Tco_1087091 [Tanacetum coccineum]